VRAKEKVKSTCFLLPCRVSRSLCMWLCVCVCVREREREREIERQTERDIEQEMDCARKRECQITLFIAFFQCFVLLDCVSKREGERERERERARARERESGRERD